jgi:hypothetical protein
MGDIGPEQVHFEVLPNHTIEIVRAEIPQAPTEAPIGERVEAQVLSRP